MTILVTTDPDVHEAFKNGHFSVQLSVDSPFGKTPVNGTTKVMVNKDTQTPGGTTRFSLKPAAVKCYYIAAEYRSASLGQLRHMIQGELASKHSDLQ